MPVYTYRCENCGVQFERTQKFSDAPLVICPECGKKALRKVYHPVGVVFKGSGFYATDNRSPSGQTRPSTTHTESKAATEQAAEARETATKPVESSDNSK